MFEIEAFFPQERVGMRIFLHATTRQHAVSRLMWAYGEGKVQVLRVRRHP